VKIFSCKVAAVLYFFSFQLVPAQVTGDLKIAFIRISFNAADIPGFTGSGDFLTTETELCGDYLIDPPPHNREYFESHIIAVNNYFKTVSYGAFGIDIDKSKVFPRASNSSYRLDRAMNFYNELGKESDHEYRITLLLKEAVEKAYEIDKINFNDFDLIAVIHPGLGQDFKLPFLDPTPEDIPSTFVDSDMIISNFSEGIMAGPSVITKGIILPESQNHPLMDPSIFNALTEPCDLQYSITGTWALMIGFAAGLPPLWQIETGKSGVGIFGLMDQGSNNGRGIIPSPPNPWTRIYAGWEGFKEYRLPQKISLISAKKNDIAKIEISNSEYFLIENRNNWYRRYVGLDSARLSVWEKTGDYPSYTKILFDSTGIQKDKNGVFVEINNYNMGMPASGILIWHINEQKIYNQISSYGINADINDKGVDLEEADGAQDIGFVSNLLSDPSSGYWGDVWFPANDQYFRSNTVSSLEFSNYTYPNSKTTNDNETGLVLNNFSRADTVMSFHLNTTYNAMHLPDENKSVLIQWDVDGDAKLDFIGTGDSLWWSSELENPKSFYKTMNNNFQLSIGQDSDLVSLALIECSALSCNFSSFIFNAIANTFILDWHFPSNLSSDIELIHSTGEHIIVKVDKSFYKIDKNGATIIEPSESFFSYTSSSGQVFYYQDFTIKHNGYDKTKSMALSSIALADLDLDGRVELIGVDLEGVLHAFDEHFNYMNGFPLKVKSSENLLIGNLIDNTHPEIIIETLDGDLMILNNEGKTQRILSLSDKSFLSSIGRYEGKSALMLGDRVLMFNETKDQTLNTWSYKNGSPNYNRSIAIDTLNQISSKLALFNKNNSYAYPNPSYGKDVIFRLDVGDATSIKISIYDLAGYLITDILIPKEKIFSNTKTSTLEVPWKINNVESGVYFAKVDVENDQQTSKKIIKVGIIK